MASKSSILFLDSFLLVATILMSGSHVEAQSIPGTIGLLNNTLINGTLFCTINGNIRVNGSTTPRFANATVQLVCGSQNVTVATTMTNALGIFTIALSPLQALVSSVLSNCRVVVNTPLSTCNPMLPSVQGVLQATLQFAGTIVQGALNIVVLTTTTFSRII